MTGGHVYQPGDRIVIRNNPFHEDAADIVGTVTRFEPEAGFMRCDLIWVRYTRPLDGSVHEMPFGDANVAPGDRQSLLARAKRHEEQAAELRRMADEAAR